MKLEKLIPMLNIADIEASLVFYQDSLGFELVSPPDAVKQWRWATIRSGNTEIMLAETQHEQAPTPNPDPHDDTSWPAIFYFYPDDVSELFAHVTQLGYQTSALETTFYGMREFSMRDPDGHLLSFGQDAAGS